MTADPLEREQYTLLDVMIASMVASIIGWVYGNPATREATIAAIVIPFRALVDVLQPWVVAIVAAVTVGFALGVAAVVGLLRLNGYSLGVEDGD